MDAQEWNKGAASGGDTASHFHTTCYDNDSEIRAFQEDIRRCSQWPPRLYGCSLCHRPFSSAQALGGHMNMHRRDRARRVAVGSVLPLKRMHSPALKPKDQPLKLPEIYASVFPEAQNRIPRAHFSVCGRNCSCTGNTSEHLFELDSSATGGRWSLRSLRRGCDAGFSGDCMNLQASTRAGTSSSTSVAPLRCDLCKMDDSCASIVKDRETCSNVIDLELRLGRKELSSSISLHRSS
ncbi:hypothetical protein KP509_05G076900 [Ceratopteris richardii]|uniref:C2H2-type domain-containing protein n=1 Tax=Ceratopteris richardii TaxID=49495 RepID=A0A8T2UN15_CERRI|nr:hypothetical protein KP509_05G076900 [Ceratopteris richardii]